MSSAQAKSTTPSSTGNFNSTLRYLPIAEIHDDTVVLKDGSVRAILEIENINFSLKSEPEQNSIIYSYQNFLNSLEFPVQILLTSKKLDIDGYIRFLKERLRQQESTLLQEQTQDYIRFIERFIEFADIMDKKSYIIIPLDRAGTSSVQKNIFQQFWERIHPEDDAFKFKVRLKEFEGLKRQLQQRVNVVKTGIESCGIGAELIETKGLIELFYQLYNPTLSYEQKIGNWELSLQPGTTKDTTKEVSDEDDISV